VVQLSLNESLAVEWSRYNRALQVGHVRITNRGDKLIWQFNPHGSYTPKVRYIHLNIDQAQQNRALWWKGVWKLQCPLKSRLFLCCAIKNKLSTWDRMKLRHWEGSDWCSLCREVEEFVTHLLIDSPFVKGLWIECSILLCKVCHLNGLSLEEAWRYWLSNHSNRNIKSLPLLINWGTWLAQNSTIFQDWPSIPALVAINSLSILSH